MKLKKPAVLVTVLLAYSVFLTVFLFPHYQRSGEWGIYAGIISVAYILTLLLYCLSKRQRKNQNDENEGV